jgi:hypothetical protein
MLLLLELIVMPKNTGDAIDDEVKAVLPINGVDLLAHTQRRAEFHVCG